MVSRSVVDASAADAADIGERIDQLERLRQYNCKRLIQNGRQMNTVAHMSSPADLVLFAARIDKKVTSVQLAEEIGKLTNGHVLAGVFYDKQNQSKGIGRIICSSHDQ